jgi:AraC family transcriptional regulator
MKVDLWRCLEDGEGPRGERYHAEPVLTVPLAGVSVLQVAGHRVIIESGTALLTGADLPYRSAHPLGFGDIGCHVRPSPGLLRSLSPPRARCAAGPIGCVALLRFRLAVERSALEATDGLELEESALELFDALPDVGLLDPGPGTTRRRVELVEETKALLLRRFNETLSLETVAGLVGASPFHLARLFRRQTGFSLHGYRTRVRLVHALDRVADFRGRLTDLALELGFSSQSHFTDAFRRVFGTPPGALARRGAGQPGPTRT